MACALGVPKTVSLLVELGTKVQDLYRTDSSGSSYWCSLITIITNSSSLKVKASELNHTDNKVVEMLHKVNWPQYLNMISIMD